ncbi:Pre-mRNA-splicing factor 38A [Phlyctochytrium bullatum]|nr:Pre-mRNA-splicing factor 38A [Phlyctochytrium bullatum]
MDEFADNLLQLDRVCDVTLPHINRRAVHEEMKELEPRVSPLEEDLELMDDDNEMEAGPSGSKAGEPDSDGEEKKEDEEVKVQLEDEDDVVSQRRRKRQIEEEGEFEEVWVERAVDGTGDSGTALEETSKPGRKSQDAEDLKGKGISKDPMSGSDSDASRRERSEGESMKEIGGAGPDQSQSRLTQVVHQAATDGNPIGREPEMMTVIKKGAGKRIRAGVGGTNSGMNRKAILGRLGVQATKTKLGRKTKGKEPHVPERGDPSKDDAIKNPLLDADRRDTSSTVATDEGRKKKWSSKKVQKLFRKAKAQDKSLDELVIQERALPEGKELAGESLSIEETNKLRMKMGLKPLTIGLKPGDAGYTGDVAMSIEETNRLRVKMGLKPLK